MTSATLGLGVLVFMVAMNTRTSLVNTATMEERARRYDVVVSFEEPVEARRIAWMGAFPIVERTESWRVEQAVLLSANRQDRALPLVAGAGRK